MRLNFFIFSLFFCGLNHTWADGNSIDKIYDPYVQLLEKELEYRLLLQQDKNQQRDNLQRHKFGYGQSFSDQWFGEVYLIASKDSQSGFSANAIEFEFKRQLSEQGEYSNDWGLLFELERDMESNSWEVGNTLIVLHQWRYWTGTANVSLIFESGEDIKDEFETAFSGQIKYRYKQGFEPGIELHWGEETQAIGPVITGVLKISGRHKLLWDTGLFFGIDDRTADVTFKVNVEFEF